MMVIDYLSIMKPRISLMLVFVSLVSLFAATGGRLILSLGLILSVSGLIASCGASAINAYVDRDIDQTMLRTRARPVASGRLRPIKVLAFGFILLVVGVVISALMINLLTALMIALGAIIYLIVYTLWLKRRSWTSILFGGLSGCCPALAGWAAAKNTLSLEAGILALIVLAWIPPHNWTFGLMFKTDYEAAQIPTLPATVGEKNTLRVISASAIVLSAISLIPFLVGFLGVVYLAAVLSASAIMFRKVMVMCRRADRHSTWSTYKSLSLYLTVLFLGVAIDSYVSSFNPLNLLFSR